MMQRNIILIIMFACAAGLTSLFPASDALAISYPSISGDNTHEWITNVTFGDINNSSVQNGNGYGNYTFDQSGQFTRVSPGNTYQLSVMIQPDIKWCKEYLYAYIDWNHDRDFADTSERIRLTADVNTCSEGPHIVNITVPALATGGETLLRVVLKYNGLPPSSGSIPEGEAEDYTLVVDYPSVIGKNTAEWITNVTLGDIINSTGRETDGYGNYTFWDTNPRMIRVVDGGEKNTLSVTIVPDPSFCTPNEDDSENISAFIDWNQDGKFNTPGEEVKVAVNTCDPGPHTVDIKVPGYAHGGRTRMRIILNWGWAPPSAGPVFGEAEDYTIFVIKKFYWPMFLPAVGDK